MDNDQPVAAVSAQNTRLSLCLRDQEARLGLDSGLQVDQTELRTRVFPCTGQGFLAAPRAVSTAPQRAEGQAMDMREQIEHRRRVLAATAELDAQARRRAVEKAASQQSAQRNREDEIKQLAERFFVWARQSGIRPRRLGSGLRARKGWALTTYKGPTDPDTQRCHSQTLILLTNGTAQWAPTDIYLDRSFAIPYGPVDIHDVRPAIIDFVARSPSMVPWPD